MYSSLFAYYYLLFDLTFTFSFLLISKTYFYHSLKLYHSQAPANERTLSNDPLADSTYRLIVLYEAKGLIWFRKPTRPSVKEGSTSNLGLLPSGKKRETVLLGTQNRYALRLTDQSGLRQLVRDETAWRWGDVVGHLFIKYYF